MSGVSITGLDPASTLTGSEIVPIVQSGTTVRTTLAAMPYVPTGTGAVTTTVQSKLRETVSVFDFMPPEQIAYIQVGNTASQDGAVVTAAIQAAIDSVKPAVGTYLTTGSRVFFPAGTYLVTSSVSTYSGIELFGVGKGTLLKAGGAISGQIFNLTTVDASGIYQFGAISNMAFQTTGTVWAIKSSATNVLNSIIQNIELNCTYGIGLCEPATYTQATRITNVTSHGAIEQLIALSGNWNLIEQIDKEGNSGTSTDPYIYIFSSGTSANGNTLRKILLEGTGNGNKVPVKFLNAYNCVLNDYWLETTGTSTNGYCIDLDNSVVSLTGVTQIQPAYSYVNVKLRNKSQLSVEFFNLSATHDRNWQSFVDADSTSIFYAQNAITRRSNNMYKIATPNNISVNRDINYNFSQSLPTGYSAVSYFNYVSGQNLLINPSLEAGEYGWNFSASPTGGTTFVASEVGQGLMMQCISTAGFQFYQNVTISSAQIGQPLTLRYVMKITGSGFAVPLIASDYQTTANRVNYDEGWQVMTVTFRPATSGSLRFGFFWVSVSGSSTIYVDEISLCAGDQGVINPSKFGSFELNQKTFTTASAAPTTGTWKIGDRVFNSSPTVGQPKSWVCTVAGTPGTWVSEGNL